MIVQSKMATRSQSQAQNTGSTIRDGSSTPADIHQEPNEGSSPLSDAVSNIEEQIEREKAESQRLRTRIREVRQQKKEAVDARIAELEREEAQRASYEAELEALLRTINDGGSGGSRKRPSSDFATTAERNVRHRRATSELEDEPFERPRRAIRDAPKFRDLPTYASKTLREAQTFLDGAERRFRMDDGARYPSDQSKIDYCVLAFGPALGAKWERYERRAGLGATTWEQFKEWMKDSIVDPANRAFDAVTSYNSARQRDGQSAEDFAAYLDSLEIELRIDDDELRRNTLYAKLREEIQRDILSRNDVPLTRQGLLSLATRIETTHRITGKGRGRRETGAVPDSIRRTDTRPLRSEDRKRDNLPRGPATGVNRTPTDPERPPRSQCPRCRSAAHRLANCPEVTCYRCNKKGHIASTCTSLAENVGSRR